MEAESGEVKQKEDQGKQEADKKVVALSTEVKYLLTEVENRIATLKVKLKTVVVDEQKIIKEKVQVLDNRLRAGHTVAGGGIHTGGKIKLPKADIKTWRMYRRKFKAAKQATQTLKDKNLEEWRNFVEE